MAKTPDWNKVGAQYSSLTEEQKKQANQMYGDNQDFLRATGQLSTPSVQTATTPTTPTTAPQTTPSSSNTPVVSPPVASPPVSSPTSSPVTPSQTSAPDFSQFSQEQQEKLRSASQTLLERGFTQDQVNTALAQYATISTPSASQTTNTPQTTAPQTTTPYPEGSIQGDKSTGIVNT